MHYTIFTSRLLIISVCPPRPSRQTLIYFIITYSAFSITSYEWNYIKRLVFFPLGVLLMQCVYFEIHQWFLCGQFIFMLLRSMMFFAYTNICLFFHLFFGYMNSFWFLALSSKIAMDISVQFFNMDIFHFSCLIPQSVMPELQDNKYITFQETSNCEIKLVSYCISVSSDRLVLPYLCQQLGMAGHFKFWPF